MFNGLDSSVVRYVIRKTRKEKGLRQEDLADKSMSYGTISNIERGTKNVDEQTTYKYLRKLGLTETRLKSQAEQEQERIESLIIQLEAIELMLDNNKGEKAAGLLKKINIERFHPLAPYYTYLEGRCYQDKRNWEKSEEYYQFAIRLHNQYNLPLRGNIVSICYNELSICFYLQNDLEKALDFVEKGIETYNENEEGKDIIFPLNSNKILYLLSSSQYDIAKQVLNELWESIPQIHNINIVLNLYKFNATILRKMKRFNEAIEICKEGIDIARRNRIQHRYIDLMNVLGSIYLLQHRLDKAKQQFNTVLNYNDEGVYLRSHVDTLTNLAITYTYMEEWTEAESLIMNALELARKVSQIYRLYKVLIVAGNACAAQGKLDEAVTYYKEAEDLAERGQDKRRQHLALLKQSNCFDKLGLVTDWQICAKKILKLEQHVTFQEEEILL